MYKTSKYALVPKCMTSEKYQGQETGRDVTIPQRPTHLKNCSPSLVSQHSIDNPPSKRGQCSEGITNRVFFNGITRLPLRGGCRRRPPPIIPLPSPLRSTAFITLDPKIRLNSSSALKCLGSTARISATLLTPVLHQG